MSSASVPKKRKLDLGDNVDALNRGGAVTLTTESSPATGIKKAKTSEEDPTTNYLNGKYCNSKHKTKHLLSFLLFFY